MQTEPLSELRQALRTLLSRIEAGEDILEQLAHIDALHQEFASAVPPDLRHYLKRKSYTKALAWLDTFCE